MKDNRGLTLVELLITVTILALVIAGAATFMLAGSRSFAKGSADSNVQGEAELAVNQIEDLIIDVNGGVDFTDNPAASTLTMYHVEADDSTGVAVNKKRIVEWKKSDNKIYSSEWLVEKDGSGAYVPTGQIYEDQLLAENVTDFNVDLSDKYTETAKDGTDIEIVRSVVIRVDCLDGTGKSTYATTPTITLRNRLMISSSPDEIFDNTPAPDDSLLLYISSTGMEGAVPVRDRVTTVERGKVYNIFVMVNAGTNVNSLCDFTVEGEESGWLSSITPEGVHIALDVDTSEPNDYLKITATYKTNSTKKVIGWVKVIGGESKSLTGLAITTLSWASLNPKFGSHVTYTPNFTDEDIAALQYTWSVTEPEEMDAFPNDQKTLELNIHKKDTNYNHTFWITLVVYSPNTNERLSKTVPYYCSKGGGEPLLERGKAEDIVKGDSDVVWNPIEQPDSFWPNNQDKDPDKDKYEEKDDERYQYPADGIRCKYYFCNEKGDKISAYNDLLDYILVDASWNLYKLTFAKDLPPENEYYIKIIIELKTWGETKWPDIVVKEPEWVPVRERVHYIPRVGIWGTKVTNAVKKNANVQVHFFYDVEGYDEAQWANSNPPVYEYEMVDINCTKPDDVTVTPVFSGAVFRTRQEMESWVSFDVTGNRHNEVVINSMVIRVSMKDHPGIYTDIPVIFK